MRMEEVKRAPRTAAPPAINRKTSTTLATAVGVSTLTGLAVFAMLTPFFLNPPVLVSMLMMPRRVDSSG